MLVDAHFGGWRVRSCNTRRNRSLAVMYRRYIRYYAAVSSGYYIKHGVGSPYRAGASHTTFNGSVLLHTGMDSDSPIAPRTAGQTAAELGAGFTAVCNAFKSEFEALFADRARRLGSHSHHRLADGDGL